MPRYVLHPGHVTSKNDGQEHFIDARQLAGLYGVPWDRCVVVRDDSPGFADQPGDVHLYPDYHGEYKLPPGH